MSALDADEAIAIAVKHGWRIFPVGLVRQVNGKITKQPLIERWPNACSADPRVIRQWWQHWPDAVPSVVTGPRNGLVILDIDIGVDDKGRPYSGFDTLEERLGWWALPEVPMVHTRRGGLHLYFACERALDDEVLDAHSPRKAGSIRNGASLLGPHLDVRGWNGQAVLPASNSGYWWDPHYNFDTCEPMRAPDWFDYRPPKPRPAPGRSSVEPVRRFDPQALLDISCCRILHAPQGKRHDTYRHETFRIARLVGIGLLDEQPARRELWEETEQLGLIADGSSDRVKHYFDMAWAEGLAIGRAQRRVVR